MSHSEIRPLSSTKEPASGLSTKFNGVINQIKTSWSARLLAFLISFDLLFIGLYVVYLFTDFIRDVGFSLQQDQGYSEIYQYIKWVGIILLFGVLFKKKQTPLYLHWLLVFSYFLLDDALLIHETVGVWLAKLINLPDLYSLQGHHWGELMVFMSLGFFFLTTLLVSYQRSEPAARDLSQSLILLLLGLVFFGVFVDLIHALVKNVWVSAWLGVVEDGGELIFASLIAWYLAKRTVFFMEEDISEQIQTAVKASLLFGLFAALFGVVQFSTPGFAGNDGYYHAKMGLLIHQQGLKPAPPQLPYTILNEEDFYDHHFLYHAYLSLFSRVDPQIDGGIELTRSIKTASIWLPSLAFVAVWWLLRKQGVAWASIWTLTLFALSGDFLYRMSMPRAQSASLLILVTSLHWSYQKRFRRLMILGFIYVWLYDAFPLLIVIAGIYVLATWMAERCLAWEALVYPTAGILMGLVVNPYFPNDISFIFNHLLPKLTNAITPVGIEWYPYETWGLVQDAGWALGVFLLGVLAMGWQEKRPNNATLTAFLLTVVFGIMLFKARRFIEYFPAFVLIFTALTTRLFVKQWQEKQPYLKRWLPALVILLSIFPFIKTMQAARTAMQSSAPAERYAAAALWLKVYSEPGSTVFQLDWDDFTRLFFYDSDKIYTVGLDPTFMELHDSALYTEWVKITQGKVDSPGKRIRTDFGGDYVFSDLKHDDFLVRAFEDPNLQEIYRDNYAIIFKVVEDLGN